MKTFKPKNLVAVFGVAALAAALQVSAEEVASSTPVSAQPPLQQTVSELISALIKQGVISTEQGDLLIKQLQPQSSAPRELPAPQSPDTLRVPYVPEAVKNAIRDEVRLGLREDVVNDIKGQAQQERWGIPGVLPEWVENVKIKGDLRLRHQSDLFADDNPAQIGRAHV